MKELMMIIDKKAINYYYSFFEVSKELNQKQFYDFNMAIYQVMFFEVHIDNIKFNDAMLTILWKSLKHSLQASIKGYCDKKSIPYDDVFAPLANPLTNNIKDKNNEEEKEKEKEKVQVVAIKEFTFNVDKQKLLSNTSKEYQNNLQEYISTSVYSMSYEDFYTQCEMKPYKYKNFKMAYDTWNKNTKQQRQQPQSFKQQDAQKTESSIDAYFRAKEQGLDLRKPNMGMPTNYEDVEVISNVK